MPILPSRAARRPLALRLAALTVLAALGACSDEPAAPTRPPALTPRASDVAGVWVDVTVTNTSGGTEAGSLRWAASQVADSGGTIWIDPSLAGDTIVLDAELKLDGVTWINAPKNRGITISGNDQHRVMSSAGSFLGLQHVTVTKGYADSGSAIAAVELALYHSNVENNRGAGSTIFVEKSVSLGNATVSGNVAGAPAIEYKSGALVQVDNSTVAYNAPGPALGVRGYPSYETRVFLHNAILSHNGSPQQNCASTFGFEYGGTNISSDWSCGEVGVVVADPLLLPLAYNGGPTRTHAIPHTSPAYNTGLGCWVETDQRYVPRDAKCDVGSFEFNDSTKVALTIDPAVKVDAATGQALLTGTITCTRNEYFRLALELHQDQKVGKRVVDVRSADDFPLECTTSGASWHAHMPLSAGQAFQTGAGRALAYTFQTPEWVAPARVERAVKLSISRK
jgi:hypothetical protein